MENSIQVCDLKKSYGNRPAVRGISFTVCPGQIFALLGPNGAGKSTALNILCTCVPPDGGLVQIAGLTLGRHPLEIRRRIGIVFQNGVLDDLLTVQENLYTRGSFYGLQDKALRERIKQTAHMTGIFDLLARTYGQLSGGQRRRCDIARALLHLPKILFLDEPTTGLDPEMRSAVWTTMRAIQSHTGMTIFLTTHDMQEAAQADQIVIMKDGAIAASGTPCLLKERFSQDSLLLFSQNIAALCTLLDAQGTHYLRCGDRLEIPLQTTLDALPLLERCHGRYSGFEVRQGSMDDAYLRVTEGGNIHASFRTEKSGPVL